MGSSSDYNHHPLDDPNWKLVNTNVSRKYNWTPEHHEACVDGKYADKPNLHTCKYPITNTTADTTSGGKMINKGT